MRKLFKIIGLQEISIIVLSTFLAVFFTAVFLSNSAKSQTIDTLWTEDWDSGESDWHVTYGTWEIDPATSGPDSSFSAPNCAATILDGNYQNYVDSTRLIRHTTFIVPPATENPHLRFWHWYSFRINDNDFGKVQIRIKGNTYWEDLPDGIFHNWDGGIWTNSFLDLSDYSGQEVEIAFYFHSDNDYTSSGWYIDDVAVISGDILFYNPEDWESGFDDWYADYGVWQVGIPTVGPDSAYQGLFCAGTILEGSYGNYLDSRLISPPIQIPSEDKNPLFRFESWYSFRINDNDYGDVEIKVVGDSNWQLIEHYTDASNGWFTSYLPISEYADSTVQFAFHFHSDNDYTASGWYIDSVRVEPISPTSIIDNNFLSLNKNLLAQNYPNPFTNQTKIQYRILNDANVHLSIYNINGELVKILVNERKKCGDYSVIWQGKNDKNSKLSPGIYFYELKTGKSFLVKKLLLLE